MSEYTNANNGDKYNIVIDYERDGLFDPLGMTRLRESYMRDDETSPQERFAFVSAAFASNQEHAQRLYDYSSKHWLSYATPILSFGKNKRGLPISCYLNFLADTSSDLVNNLSETNWLSMYGGGVGVHVGIRGADDKSVGVMPHLKTYDACTLAYKQGSRRGSYAMYLDMSHPDIVQFLEMRKPTGDQNLRTLNLHHGVNISDKFMQIIERCMVDPEAKDDWELIQPNTGKVKEVVSAKELWSKLLELRIHTGEPYIWFIDRANEGVPEYQKAIGLKNHGSNLCVAPETLILTDEGYQQIADLEDEQVNVWNGKEFSSTKVVKTGENQKLLKVKTNCGFELECTPYHKFYVAMRHPTGGNRWVIEKRANELVKGDKLIKCDFPIIEGTTVLENAYENGLFSAEGFVDKSQQKIYFYHEKRKLKDFVNQSIFTNWYVQESENREIATTRSLRSKFFVPNGDFTIASKLKWFAGLCDGDGTVTRNGKTQSIQVGSINYNMLLEVQLLLQTLGVSSKVTMSRDEGWNWLPKNDGTGDNKEYWTQKIFRLLIGQTGICTLQELGFKTNRLVLSAHVPNRECTQFTKVTEVLDEGRYDDTYCFTEPKRGMGVFNGILTGQCSEISLVTSPDRTAVCCLSSPNLEYYDEWSKDDKFLRDILEMLDNVLQYFIDNAPDEISRARYSAERERSVGIGALGFHAYLQKRGFSFEGVMAKSVNNQIFKHMRAGLDKANFELAQERGACPDAADFGVMKRCSHTSAIAPNASTSLIMGNTSPSTEPFAANVYRQDTSSGAYVTKNKYLDKILKELAVGKPEDWYNSTWASITANDGSVQHLDELDENTKAIFKTGMEIDQRWIIEHAADRQKMIDQAASTNIYLRPDVAVKYLHAVHFQAWKQGLKSLYYVRSSKLRKADKVGQKVERKRIEDEIDLTALVNNEECLSCQG